MMGSPYETVICILKTRPAPEERVRFLEHLTSVLPHLNWRSHVFLVGEDLLERMDTFEEIIQALSSFLTGQKISILHVHPFVKMAGFTREDARKWDRLASLMKPFQVEAYQQQGEARMLILPILEPVPSVPLQGALSAADFFQVRLARPSLYFRGRPAPDPARITDKALRIYIDPDPDSGLGGVVTRLRDNFLFEDVLERVEGESSSLLDPCRKRLVLEEDGGKVYSCFARWVDRSPLHSLEALAEPRDRSGCSRCISRACASMGPDLKVNSRENEARQVFFKLAMALSHAGAYPAAEAHARRAFEFSTTSEERSAALLHQGLCNLDMMNLEKAEAVLKLGAGHSSDPGLFAYHRGRVQFAWRDTIEAIDRFEEALAAGSPAVPERDVLFHLSVSHINLEEYKEARPYLDRIFLLEGPSPPILLYQGLCDLGENQVESSLQRFTEAIDLGPEPEDLSRVLFYKGTALKELGRFEEAIQVLRKAVEADPEDIVNYNLLGFCYYKTEQHREAVRCFRRAIDIDPTSAMDHANLASNLRDLGKPEEALAMYEKALSLDPTIGFARENADRLRKQLER